MSSVLPAALAYFAAVFVTGFALGTVRVLLLVPALGERWAELAELPVMLTVSAFAARGVVRRFHLARATGRLATGLLALAALVAVELGVVLALRGLTMAEYVATRDPVAGLAYVGSLLGFGLLPLAFRPAASA